MPNWCQGYLEVKGSYERLVEFDNKFKAKHISMETSSTTMLKKMFDESKYAGRKYRVGPYKNQFASDKDKEESITIQMIDTSKEVEDYSFINFVAPTEEDYLNGWYDWNCNHWGTKWDVCDFQEPFELTPDDDAINYTFCTAWSPCEPVIDAISKAFTDLEFQYSYEEDGMQFAGIVTYKDGERTEEHYSEDNKYREFQKEYLDRDFCTCGDCGSLVERYEYEDEGKCPECESTNILDECGNKINKEEIEENKEERKDE